MSVVPPAPGLLARGPWAPHEIDVAWRPEVYEPAPSAIEAADEAIAALQRRGSPSHDGLAARLSSYAAGADGLSLELQPIRWALRLTAEDASQSMSVICIVRTADGRWLAGRRAGWLATWPGRWALGAAGSVEVDEHPAETMERELQEEWSVDAERITAEGLIKRPNGMVMLVGQAWLPNGAQVTPDSEHDDFAWWPADVASWPGEAHEALRRMATWLAQAT